MSESEGSGAGQREVAYRLFAAEYEDADFSYSESDEERAPNYVITPTGARANRLFVVGVLTEVEEVSEDVLRARVVDPTGAFVLYAGQYQPDEQAFLGRAQPPMFVAVTGKARTFTPDDSEQVYTSIRPESISEVDEATRDRWTVQAAEQTIDRIGWMATALSLEERAGLRETLRERGADDGLAHGIELALDHYGTTPTYLEATYEMALEAARVVAGEADEIEEHTAVPDASGDLTVADLTARVPLPTEQAEPQVEEFETADRTTADETGSDVDTESEDETAAETGATAGETAISETETTEVSATAPDTDEEQASPEPGGADERAAERADPESTGAQSPSTDEPEREPEPEGRAETSEELGDFEPEEFELEEETREEIEAEFGTDFQSGTEVEEPGNADIDTPDPEEIAESAEPDSPTGVDTVDEQPGEIDEPETDVGAQETAETAEETDEPGSAETSEQTLDDPETEVVEVMSELDSGDGVKRETLISEMEQRYEIDSEAIEEAIQSALMSGKCYEPDDTTLKPI